MKKYLKWIIGVIALAVFLYSVGNLAAIRLRYRTAEKLYDEAAESYTQAVTPEPSAAAEADEETPSETENRQMDRAPIKVNFDELLAVNPDIIGWIYCEGTVINYPVVHAPNNEYYLHLSYDGKISDTGTIFSDASNRPGVQDSNIILYGHHMQNMTMFAILKYWKEQDFYDEHPVMWFLTPEQDYRLDLYSVHSTPADSWVYAVFLDTCKEFEEYIAKAKAESSFQSDVEPDPELYHLVLSTCAYSYYNERTVMHGQLVPVERFEESLNEGDS